MLWTIWRSVRVVTVLILLYFIEFLFVFVVVVPFRLLKLLCVFFLLFFPLPRQSIQRTFSKNSCLGCNKRINSEEFVMRTLNNVFHLKCFTCVVCGSQLQKGEQYVVKQSQLFCRNDYEKEVEMFKGYNGKAATPSTVKSSIHLHTSQVTFDACLFLQMTIFQMMCMWQKSMVAADQNGHEPYWIRNSVERLKHPLKYHRNRAERFAKI